MDLKIIMFVLCFAIIGVAMPFNFSTVKTYSPTDPREDHYLNAPSVRLTAGRYLLHEADREKTYVEALLSFRQAIMSDPLGSLSHWSGRKYKSSEDMKNVSFKLFRSMKNVK